MCTAGGKAYKREGIRFSFFRWLSLLGLLTLGDILVDSLQLLVLIECPAKK